MKIREIIQTLFPTRTWKLAAIIAGGVLCGLGLIPYMLPGRGPICPMTRLLA